MSTELDEKLIPKIKETVDRFGKELTFVERVVKVDPVAGKNTVSHGTEFKVKCTPPEGASVKETMGDKIVMGDQKTFVPAADLGFLLEEGMSVHIDEETWHIVAIKPIRTGEEVALYEVWMRR